jgi:type IV pilus assembly protein PilW
MISLAIGLVILAALVALFVNASRNNREMATAASVIENGRFAIELLESDVMHAGYWGTYVPDFDDQTRESKDSPVSTPVEIPDPCEPYVDGAWVNGTDLVNALIGIPVQAFGDAAAVCPAVVTNRVPGTDALVIRHAQRCLPGQGSCEVDARAAAASKLYIQGNLCEDGLGTPYVFARTAPAGDAPFVLRQRDCVTLAPKRRFVSYIYWVRDFAAEVGDGIPTLVRSEFDIGPGGSLAHRAAVPLVEGIDGLWVELGIDRRSITGGFVRNNDPIDWDDKDTKTRAVNRGDGVPDNFVRCVPECDGLPPAVGDPAEPPLDDLTNVTAVKLYVVARSREATPGYRDTKTYSIGAAGVLPAFNDGFKRHVYSTTVRLPNVSGRRERP